jgi:transposase
MLPTDIETSVVNEPTFPGDPQPIDFPTSACCSECNLKDALIDLRWRVNKYESHFKKALLREAELKQKLEDSQARIKYLERQLYDHKSEQHFHAESDLKGKKENRPRRQQTGSKGHGRREQKLLPVREQKVDLNVKECTICGKPFLPFPDTEDSEEVVIDVQAYRRKYRRYRYTPGCDCEGNRRIITAPLPPKVIPKSRIDMSVWIHILAC